ncbi:MAG: class I adenylate-forming enzyme family protein [Clostridia bacterium]|nr:class I adenylate-forming enzyme family protein [Clostridia bacterium]
MNYFDAKLTEEERARLPYLETIPMLLEKCGHDYADRLAVADNDRQLTYAQLLDEVGRCRTILADFAPDAHIGVMCRNNVDAMCWMLAVPSSGRVVTMLPASLSAPVLGALVKKFDLAALVMDAEFLPLADALPLLRVTASQRGEAYTEAAAVTRDTVAAIFMTGGTTGTPKGAVLSHGALMRGAHNGTYRPAGRVFGNRYILMLPMSHIFGAVAGFLSCLYTGSVIHGCKDVRTGVMMIPRLKPTGLVLVPGIVDVVLSLAKLKGKAFLGDLNAIICGAAPVPARLMTQLQAYGISLYAGYGLTEGTNLTCANLDTDKKPHTMGHFFPHQEAKVVDGELWIRGDNLMNGYYNDPEETARVLEDGWLKTGDLVEIDEDGDVTIVGRIKNLIILPNGENVSPEELENLVNQSNLVQDCLVRADEENKLWVEIYPTEQAKAMGEAMQQAITDEVSAINKTLPTFKRMNRITLREEDFKRTGAMKIDRRNS